MPRAKLSHERIAREANLAVRRGGIRHKVRNLTLRALRERKLDPEQMKDVIHAMTEGISLGVARRTDDVHHALSQAFSGLDEALMKSAEASQLALRELASRSRGLRRGEIERALGKLERLEEEFLSTVNRASAGAGQQARAAWRDVIMHARRNGTDTGARVAGIVRDFSSSMGTIAMDGASAGFETAREASTRLAELAAGFLSGMTDAMRDRGNQRRASSTARKRRSTRTRG